LAGRFSVGQWPPEPLTAFFLGMIALELELVHLPRSIHPSGRADPVLLGGDLWTMRPSTSIFGGRTAPLGRPSAPASRGGAAVFFFFPNSFGEAVLRGNDRFSCGSAFFCTHEGGFQLLDELSPDPSFPLRTESGKVVLPTTVDLLFSLHELASPSPRQTFRHFF